MANELSPLAGVLLGQSPPGVEEPQPGPDEKDQEADPSAEAKSEPESDLTITPKVEEPAELTVAKLAAKLDMPVEDLYRDLVLDMGGENVSLGSFKDRAKDLARSEQLLNDATQSKLESENQILRSNRELALAAQRLGRQPTDAEKRQAEQLHQEYVKVENQRTMAAIHDWQDQAVRTEDLENIASLMGEYGFSPTEMQGTVDHRHVKLLRDYSALRVRLKKAATSEVRKGKPIKSAKRRIEAAPKTAAERYKAGELSQQQAVLAAIADGAK